MQPNLTDATLEFTFSAEEEILAQQLDPIKIGWYQTKYAKLWKERNSLPAPADPKDDRVFFLRLAEIDGQMMVYQAILDEHKLVTSDINAARAAQVEQADREQANIAERAAKQVHKLS